MVNGLTINNFVVIPADGGNPIYKLLFLSLDPVLRRGDIKNT